MKLIEYLYRKHPDGNYSILESEAKIFGVEYPVKKKWVLRFADTEITLKKLTCLAIELLKENTNSHTKKHVAKMIDLLQKEKQPNDHDAANEHIKSIKAIFPRMDLHDKENMSQLNMASPFIKQQAANTDKEPFQSDCAAPRLVDAKWSNESLRRYPNMVIWSGCDAGTVPPCWLGDDGQVNSTNKFKNQIAAFAQLKEKRKC